MEQQKRGANKSWYEEPAKNWLCGLQQFKGQPSNQKVVCVHNQDCPTELYLSMQ